MGSALQCLVPRTAQRIIPASSLFSPLLSPLPFYTCILTFTDEETDIIQSTDLLRAKETNSKRHFSPTAPKHNLSSNISKQANTIQRDSMDGMNLKSLQKWIIPTNHV